jgi:hypothetical protein
MKQSKSKTTTSSISDFVFDISLAAGLAGIDRDRWVMTA